VQGGDCGSETGTEKPIAAGQGGKVAAQITAAKTFSKLAADSDEAGHAFQSEAGHLFRSEAGRSSDINELMSAPSSKMLPSRARSRVPFLAPGL
jgi:hypothetical protein